jgi:hypothetical protein
MDIGSFKAPNKGLAAATSGHIDQQQPPPKCYSVYSPLPHQNLRSLLSLDSPKRLDTDRLNLTPQDFFLVYSLVYQLLCYTRWLPRTKYSPSRGRV